MHEEKKFAILRSMDFKVKIAIESDVNELQELIILSARGLSVGFYTEQQIESAVKFIFGVDSQLIEDRTYFFAEINGEKVGCGGWSKRKTLFGGDQFKKSIPDPLLDPKRESARIRAFFVHPKWGRKGVAKQILDACESAAREEGFTFLELGSTLPGVPFYSALGFEELEPIDITLPDGTHLPVVHMGKKINDTKSA